jgi:hypothetical protein
MIIIPKFNLAAALKPLFQAKGRGVIPEPEFTPFNLSALRQTPKRDLRQQKGRETQAPGPGHVEAIA